MQKSYNYLSNEVKEYYDSIEHMILNDFFESLLHVNWEKEDDMGLQYLDRKVWKTFMLLNYFRDMRTDK